MYIPLGGNSVSVPRNYTNLMVTFLVSGLWHGANWTFVIWGLLHGTAQVVVLGSQKIVKKHNLKIGKLKIPSFIKIFITFIFVCFAWIFFRANSLNEAFFAVKQLGFLPQETALLFKNIVSLNFVSGLFAPITL